MSAAWAGSRFERLEISGNTVTHEEIIFNQFGRVHDVIVGPDGYLYTTLQLPGRVLSESTEGMIVGLHTAVYRFRVVLKVLTVLVV